MTQKNSSRNSRQNSELGFTIVELLIVIVVIGILAALVITTFSGIQQKARDTQRITDIKAIHSSIEAFYSGATAGSTAYYPTLAEINDATWRSTNLKGLDSEALLDPKGSSSTLATTPSSTEMGYAPLSDSNTVCASSDVAR